MLNKIKQFLGEDIRFKLNSHTAESTKPKKDWKMRLDRRFFIFLLLGLFVFGFWGGSYYGPIVWEKAKQEFQSLYQQFSGVKSQKVETPSQESAATSSNQALPEISKPLIDQKQLKSSNEPYQPLTNQEEAIMEVVKKASPAVVSIAITKEVQQPTLKVEPEGGLPFNIEILPDDSFGTSSPKKRKVGAGTGFIISQDGLILTNKHVVSDEKAEYSVVTNEGQNYQLKVLAKDPFQDLAICQIVKTKANQKFPVLELGDSNSIQIGQTVVAIGNALGEFSNTVSVGVISGLSRTIAAGDGAGLSETLEDIIQTDAAINKGNSGGPLLNLKAKVVGVNVAIAEQAQSIGFALLINKAKRDIEQVQKQGKISYPFLGVRYVLITPELKQQYPEITVDYGALVVQGNDPSEVSVVPGSAADKAGLKNGDIILAADGQKIDKDHSLAKIVQAKKPGDKIVLKILRSKQELTLPAILGEKSSQ
jgi:serine protease Do